MQILSLFSRPSKNDNDSFFNNYISNFNVTVENLRKIKDLKVYYKTIALGDSRRLC